MRWGWRTLTSMRTAVVLLALLALAAVPGSLLPQRNVASEPNAALSVYRTIPEAIASVASLQGATGG